MNVILFAVEPPEHIKRLLETLGWRWQVDESRPDECPCGCSTRGNDTTVRIR